MALKNDNKVNKIGSSTKIFTADGVSVLACVWSVTIKNMTTLCNENIIPDIVINNYWHRESYKPLKGGVRFQYTLISMFIHLYIQYLLFSY